jgi:hypothetical protein
MEFSLHPMPCGLSSPRRKRGGNGKEGERNFIFLPEKIHFKITVSRANTD